MAKKKKGILGTLAGAIFGNGSKKSSSARSRRSSSSSGKTSRKKSTGKSTSSKRVSSGRKAPPKSATKTPSKASTGKNKVPYQDRTDNKAKKPLIQKMVSLLKKRSRQLKKVYPKNEFRYNHQTEHMNYVFGENADEYKSVGLTTKVTTFGQKNMKLVNNPKTGDPSDESYIRNGIISDGKGSFSKKKAKNFEFSKDDKANVKSKIRHYKKEQKRAQKK